MKQSLYTVLVMAAIFLLVACGGDKPEAPVTPSVPATSASVPSNTPTISSLPRSPLDNEPGTQSSALAYHKVAFESTALGKTFVVQWTIFTNYWHPNGFVVIESLGVTDGTTYRLGQVSPETYVERIHEGVPYAPGNSTVKNDPIFRDWFRTAEAAVCAAYTVGGPQSPSTAVAEDAVAAAGRAMFGRQFGLPAAYPLK